MHLEMRICSQRCILRDHWEAFARGAELGRDGAEALPPRSPLMQHAREEQCYYIYLRHPNV